MTGSNQAAAAPGEFGPLRLGTLSVWPPVVLAPMAGVTNYPFRAICREQGAGLCTSEMITARALLMDNPKTWHLASFGPDEAPRSLQLYGVDPRYVGDAVRRLVQDAHVDHIDLNFGCPVRKVTRKGGGAAIPVKPQLLAAIVRAAVEHAGSVPVTIKVRMGIDEGLITFRDSARIAEDEGCAAITLHARTAAQLYDGQARWEAVGELKALVPNLTVLGNGDIWEAQDAVTMMRKTGCDGVVIGRGCLGRPWLFRDLARIFDGKPPLQPPRLGEVMDTMMDHARRTADWFGESAGLRAFRKQTTWYTKGFRGSAQLRQRLVRCSSLAELGALAREVDGDEPFPTHCMRVSRGKTAGTQRVALPDGYLERRHDATPPGPDAAALFSGG